METLKTWFTLFDVNGDGDLDETEFANVMEMIGTPRIDIEEQWEGMKAQVDLDKDGKISQDEFITFWQSEVKDGRENTAGVSEMYSEMKKGLDEAEEELHSSIATWFDLYDLDQDGEISEEEFLQVSSQRGMTREEITKAWQDFKSEADTNQDGIVSLNEFLQYWRREVREGKLSLQTLAKRAHEIVAALDEARGQELTRMLKRWFGLFDINGDGSIEEKEYLAALELQLRSKFFFSQKSDCHRADLLLEWEAFVQRADMDQDGLISEREFIEFWKKRDRSWRSSGWGSGQLVCADGQRLEDAGYHR